MTEKQTYCKWRGDPGETFSDWTIEIVSEKISEDEIEQIEKYSKYLAKNLRGMQSSSASLSADESDKVIQKYFVHRVTLGYGPRKCDYFEKLFRHARDGNFVKKDGPIQSSNTSRIEIPTLAAAAFPCFLDYLYDPRTSFEFDGDKSEYPCDSGTLVCLYFLDQYFGNSDSEAYSVITEQLKSGKGDGDYLYYVFLKALGFDDLITILARSVGQRFNLKEDLIETAGIGDFWMEVAGNISIDLEAEDESFLKIFKEYKSALWSKKVYELSKCHVCEFTYEVFLHLTTIDILPIVHPEVAEPLFKLETTLKDKSELPNSYMKEKGGENENKNKSIKDRDVLILVCDQCTSIPLHYRCERCNYVEIMDSI